MVTIRACRLHLRPLAGTCRGLLPWLRAAPPTPWSRDASPASGRRDPSRCASGLAAAAGTVGHRQAAARSVARTAIALHRRRSTAVRLVPALSLCHGGHAP